MPPTNVLLATDLDCRTDRAMDRAVALASQWGTRLVIVHAIEGQLTPRERARDPQAVAMQRIREDIGDAHGVPLELVVEERDAVQLTLDTITKHGCELVVAGVARNSALGRVTAGATVDALARRSPVPLLAVKTRSTHGYHKVLVATDFSETSRSALRAAVRLFPDAEIILFHAYEVLYESFMDDKSSARAQEGRHVEEQARDFLAATPDVTKRVTIRCEHGQPEGLLRELVPRLGVDLVVVGTRGRGPVAQFFLGSVAKSLLVEVPRDVLVVSDATRA